MTGWLDAAGMSDFVLGQRPVVQGVAGFAAAAFKQLVRSCPDEFDRDAVARSAGIVGGVHGICRLVSESDPLEPRISRHLRLSWTEIG